MRLRAYQWAELLGILFLVTSTATQIFYVEPLKREIEWRLAAFNMQQNGALQMKAIYATRIATMQALNAPASQLKDAEAERDVMLDKYRVADANVSDFLIAKEPIENYLQIAVLGLFTLGSLLAGIGRAIEMIASRRID